MRQLLLFLRFFIFYFFFFHFLRLRGEIVFGNRPRNITHRSRRTAALAAFDVTMINVIARGRRARSKRVPRSSPFLYVFTDNPRRSFRSNQCVPAFRDKSITVISKGKTHLLFTDRNNVTESSAGATRVSRYTLYNVHADEASIQAIVLERLCKVARALYKEKGRGEPCR